MRAGAVVVFSLASSLTALGCIDHESATSIARDPSSVSLDFKDRARDETTIPVDRVSPPSRATSRTVRCGCDADANLHVAAPQGSLVTRPEDASHAAEAQIVIPEDGPPRARPIRTSRSLGFIGDAPLTPSPSRGGPWNAPDAVLPPHTHGSWSNGGGYGSGYRSFGYGHSGFQPSVVSAPRPYRLR
jgi:hypothetical protein